MIEQTELILKELLGELKAPYVDEETEEALIGLDQVLESVFKDTDDNVPEWIIHKFRDVLENFLGLSSDAQFHFLACLDYLYDPYKNRKPEFDLRVVKENLHNLEISTLQAALDLISDERSQEAVSIMREFLDHDDEDIRETAEMELKELGCDEAG